MPNIPNQKLLEALATAYCASLACPRPHKGSGAFCYRGWGAANAVLPVLESILGSCSKHGKCVMLTHVVEDPDLDLSTIVTGGHIQYEHTETPEEVQKRVEGARESEARHMQWIRDRYEFYFGEGKES